LTKIGDGSILRLDIPIALLEWSGIRLIALIQSPAQKIVLLMESLSLIGRIPMVFIKPLMEYQ